jgi:hypothetical protein
MRTDGNPGGREKIEPFYPELLDEDGLRSEDASEEIDGLVEGSEQKERDSHWHSFETSKIPFEIQRLR